MADHCEDVFICPRGYFSCLFFESALNIVFMISSAIGLGIAQNLQNLRRQINKYNFTISSLCLQKRLEFENVIKA